MKSTNLIQFVCLFLIALFSCKQSVSAPIQETPIQAEVIKAPENDTTAIVQGIRKFIHWYQEHYAMVNQVKFLARDKSSNYQVNLSECSQYLKNLESSGLISPDYLKEWNKYFESKAVYLKENPVSEGPPEGFEFDLVLITQEPELVWNAIDSLTIEVKMTSDQKAVATILGDFAYEIDMSKLNGVWKIDYISTMNYD